MAPVYHGHFSFNVDTFYVTTSGGHIHPRASRSELDAIFSTIIRDRNSNPDHLGHWYEAQVLHYGLTPTKSKATAKVRLLEALQEGHLDVPEGIRKIEKDLRNEWTKHDLETRFRGSAIQLSLSSTLNTTMTVPVDRGIPKRSLDDGQETVFCSAVVDGPSVLASVQPQRTNIPPSSAQNKKRRLNTEGSRLRLVNTARSYAEGSGTNVQVPLGANLRSANPHSGALPRVISTSMVDEHQRPAPNRIFHHAQRHTVASSFQATSYPRDPQLPSGPLIPPVADPLDDYRRYDYMPDINSNQCSTSSTSQPTKGRLGLLNGEYDIFSDDFEDWPEEIPPGGFNLALCMEGNKIWGEYDFGTFHGIIYMTQRPRYASMEKHSFKWRGQDGDGVSRFASANEGWIRFLGDGEIEGEINCSGWLEFRGQRCVGQGTSRPRDLDWLKQEWDRL
ncbi:hypothetical protein N7457_007970, partial [Penicillium paradoxum]|uniref:uncharacterized protein n=1 Tax=Penicillium paradoxum TaxID=176176 RepID=UPI002548251D